MFESITRKERLGFPRLALVAAVAAVAFGAQLVLLRDVVGKPLAAVIEQIDTARQVIPRDALPEYVEEIVIVAPYRPRRMVLARSAPKPGDLAWTAPQYGICPAR
jgi:hypothetical protein